VPQVSEDVMQRFVLHGWPGNVRELKNVIDRAVVLAEDLITNEHLPPLGAGPRTGRGSWPPEASPDDSELDDLAESRVRTLPRTDRDSVADALRRCGGNQTRAAKLLGVSRRTLITRLEHYGLPRPRKGKGNQRDLDADLDCHADSDLDSDANSDSNLA
jgi:DNA-binding NtrC family response regulator